MKLNVLLLKSNVIPNIMPACEAGRLNWFSRYLEPNAMVPFPTKPSVTCASVVRMNTGFFNSNFRDSGRSFKLFPKFSSDVTAPPSTSCASETLVLRISAAPDESGEWMY